MYSLLSFAVPKTVQVGSPHTDGATLPWGTYLLAGIALKCRTLKSFPHSQEILISKGVMGTLIPRDCGIQHLEWNGLHCFRPKPRYDKGLKNPETNLSLRGDWSLTHWKLTTLLGTTEPLKVKPLQHSAGHLCLQTIRYLFLSHVDFSFPRRSTDHATQKHPEPRCCFLRRKREGPGMCHPERKWIMTFLFTWKSLICSPTPSPHPFQEKGFQLRSLGVSERNKMSVFSFIQRIFLGLCSTQASGRQGYFTTVHPLRCLKQPRTHTCGILYYKCNLALELNTKPDQLSDQSKAFLPESLDFSHFLPL